jgi:DNA-directed RNA polymerase specialized sigma24 family protein
MKVTPEVVERILGLRRLGRRVADIAQLCGLSEPTVKKVLRRATTKKSATETQENGTEIDCED